MTEPPGAPHRARAGAGRYLGKALFSTLWRGTAIDAHLVPRSGPVVLVANHTGFLDGPFVFAAAPRPVTFLVKAQTFQGPLGPLLAAVGQIPIDRAVGDRRALGVAKAVLARGGAVGIFPEGTRGIGDVAQVNNGAAWLALQTDSPIVPVACLGTRSIGMGRNAMPRLRARLVAVFGEPFTVESDPTLPGRERLRRGSDLLRTRLAAHVAQAAERAGVGLPDDPLTDA